MSLRWLVAGTAGGVGTSTVTALLFALGRDRLTAAPQLFDHTGGTLAGRLPDGDEARAVDPRLSLVDLGPHAAGAAIDELADHDTVLVVVSGATTPGCVLAGQALQAVRSARGADGLQRTVLVLTETFGRHQDRAGRAGLEADGGCRGVLTLRSDAALAAGGRIALGRLSRRTQREAGALFDLVMQQAV